AGPDPVGLRVAIGGRIRPRRWRPSPRGDALWAFVCVRARATARTADGRLRHAGAVWTAGAAHLRTGLGPLSDRLHLIAGSDTAHVLERCLHGSRLPDGRLRRSAA